MKTVRIGLIRHFEVTKPFPSGWVTSQELLQWLEDYDQAEVIERALELGGIEWRRCFSSDMSRAYRTAKAAFPGPITQMPELREPRFTPFQTGNLRLPFQGWRWLLRLAWMSSHASQRVMRDEFYSRVRRVTEELLAKAEEDTLVVSHAGVMIFLRRELLRLGFAGPNFRFAENGRLYVFEKRGYSADVIRR
ncbi:MAG: histidine phosphatase family protein [Verrucomicrobiota bacterium]